MQNNLTEKIEQSRLLNHSRRKLLGLAGIAGAGALLAPLLAKAAPTTVIEAGSNVDTASYIIFKDGSTIYAKNGNTGKIDFQGTDASTVIQSAINALTGGGQVFIKNGIYTINSTIYYNYNNIRITGEGLSTQLKFANGATGNMIDFRTSAGATNENAALHYMFIDGNKNNCPGGGAGIRVGGGVGSYADIQKVIDVLIQNCKGFGIDAEYVFNFNLTGSQIYTNYGGGLLVDHIEGSQIFCTTFWNNNRRGIMGNAFEIYIIGVKVDSTTELDYGGEAIYLTPAPFDVLISNCEFQNNAREAIHLENRTLDGGGFRIIGNIFKDNSAGHAGELAAIRLDTAGEAHIISDIAVVNNVLYWQAGYHQNSHFLKIANTQKLLVADNVVDNIAIAISFLDGTPSSIDRVHHNVGYITENKGAASVSDGGTISHGLVKTPTSVRVTPSIAGEMVSVTSISPTNFTVAIKKPDGSAGTPQTIYWEAEA